MAGPWARYLKRPASRCSNRFAALRPEIGYSSGAMRVTKVYTRAGDAGETRLVGGSRVPKDDPRVEAYGTVDELNSLLGVVRAELARSAAPDKQRAALDAQLAVDGATGKYPDFKGNVSTVYTHPLSQGGASNSHYDGNAQTYMDVGQAMGEAMVQLIKLKK